MERQQQQNILSCVGFQNEKKKKEIFLVGILGKEFNFSD